MSINNRSQKTEYLCVGGTEQDIQLDDGNIIKSCTNFTYLGTKIHKSGRSDEALHTKINNARKIIG